MMVALFITFMLVYFHFMRPPAEEEAPSRTRPGVHETVPAPASPTTPTTPLTPGLGEEAASPAVPVDSIRIHTGTYEAEFTTRGAGLRRYRLKEYHRTAHRPAKPADRLMLLDELAPGHVSCVIRNLDTGRVRTNIRHLEYRLVSAPDFAEFDAKVDVDRNPDGRLVFLARSGDWEILKTYVLPLPADPASSALNPVHPDPTASEDPGYGFRIHTQFRNLSDGNQTLAYDLVGAAGILPDDAGRFAMLQGASAFLKGREEIGSQTVALTSLAKDRLVEHNNLRTRWVGLSNRFFSAVLLGDPAATLAAGFERMDAYTPAFILANPPYPEEGNVWFENVLKSQLVQGEAILSMDQVQVEPGGVIAHEFSFYGGPTSDHAVAFDPTLAPLLQFHWAFLQPISNFMLLILDLVYGVVQNYGLAIIFLTILVKICLHPLTRKGLSSAHKMQKMQPLLLELKKKYGNDRVKLQQEQMVLYKEHGVNPIGGCLPMLLQMPIFFALYGVFSRSFPIRQASFIPGWIDDLSQPDQLFGLPFTVPYFEWSSFNLLPLVYLVLQFLHMSMQPKSQDPQVQQQQKMMRIMPIFFVFIFYSMPSGLVLYFVIQTLFTLLEHWMIKQKLDTQTEAAVAEGTPAVRGAHAPAGAGINTGAGAGVGIGGGHTGGGKKKKKKK